MRSSSWRSQLSVWGLWGWSVIILDVLICPIYSFKGVLEVARRKARAFYLVSVFFGSFTVNVCVCSSSSQLFSFSWTIKTPHCSLYYILPHGSRLLLISTCSSAQKRLKQCNWRASTPSIPPSLLVFFLQRLSSLTISDVARGAINLSVCLSVGNKWGH